MFYVQVFTLLLNYTGFCTNNFNLYSGFVVFNSYILFDITFDLITQQTVSNCTLHCKMNGLIEKHLCTKQTKCYTQHNKLYTSLKTVHYIHYTENRTEMYTWNRTEMYTVHFKLYRNVHCTLKLYISVHCKL